MPKYPGIQAVHAIITPNCRVVHGSPVAALEEAFNRIRKEYESLQLPVNAEANFHVALTVERPEMRDSTGLINEGMVHKGGLNDRPTTPQPPPPKGQGGKSTEATLSTRKDWHCAKCGNKMQFMDGICMDCFGGDPGD